MSDEPTPRPAGDKAGGTAGDAPDANAGDTPLSDEERERIRAEELRAFQERSYRKEVRREIRGASFWDRLLRVLRLEPGVFEEIAADERATLQAVGVLALASAVSSLLGLLLLNPLALLAVPSALVGNAIAAGIVFLVMRAFAAKPPDYLPLFRVLGFAFAPNALGLIPCLGTFAGFVYAVVLSVVAIRELGRLSTGEAVIVYVLSVVIPFFVIGFLILALVGMSLVSLLGLGALAG